MSTNLVHVLTVIGDYADEVEEACDALLAKRVEQEPGCYGTEDWSDRDRRAIDAICKPLIVAARGLPMLYYAAYVDGWSMAGQQHHLLEWPDGVRRQLCGDEHDLAYYPHAFRDDLLSQIKSARRCKFYRENAESRWYLDHIREAIDAALWLNAPFLVVSITEFLGPTRHNEDIEASLTTRPSDRLFPGSRARRFADREVSNYEATTLVSAALPRRAGRMTISTSLPRAFRNRKSRSIEKPSSLPRNRAETLG